MFQESLELNANDRVFGYAVYGPELVNFGQNPQAKITQLR
jgi:hypothetical protein